MTSEVAIPEGGQELDSFERSLAAERVAEQTLMRSITKSIAIGLPVGVVFFIVLLTIAISDKTQWYVVVGVGTIMGVIAAVMFGMLGGVTLVAHTLEEVDKGHIDELLD
jgi:Mg/Co/Ni transporter MgtE